MSLVSTFEVLEGKITIVVSGSLSMRETGEAGAWLAFGLGSDAGRLDAHFSRKQLGVGWCRTFRDEFHREHERAARGQRARRTSGAAAPVAANHAVRPVARRDRLALARGRGAARRFVFAPRRRADR